MKEKSFQFQKLYWIAVSREISVDTKMPLKASDHLISNRKEYPKRKTRH